MSETTCPAADRHTPAPRGFIAWHSWAAAMHGRGFNQVRCDGCGLLKIWNTSEPIDPQEHESACLFQDRPRRRGRQAS